MTIVKYVHRVKIPVKRGEHDLSKVSKRKR